MSAEDWWAGNVRPGRAVRGGSRWFPPRVRSQEIGVLVLTNFFYDLKLLIKAQNFVFSSKMRIRSPAPICS